SFESCVALCLPHSFPTRRSSDLSSPVPFLTARSMLSDGMLFCRAVSTAVRSRGLALRSPPPRRAATVISLMSLVKIFPRLASFRSEEHTSELQSPDHLVCRLLLA